MNSNTNLIINRRTKRNIEKIESDSDNSLIDDFYSKIDSLIDTLNKTLPKRTKYDYWDINSEFITNEIIEVSDKHLSNTVATIKKRLSLRLFSGSRMGFAYTENFDKDFRKNLIDSAIDSLLSYNSIKSKKNEEEHQLYIGKSLKMSRATRQRVNSQNISFRDKINDNIEAQKSLNPSKMRISFLTNYVNTSKHKGYFSSNGDDLRQHLNYESYQAVATSFGKTIEQGYHKVGKQIGYEIKHYFPEVLETAQHMSEILQKAKIPKGGKFKVITSPSLTEVFIHEALGHASESDIVLNHQSCLQGKMNTRISKDYVDVFDDSTVPESWGSFFFDDEGIPAQKTPIIKKGILNSFLHSRETAVKFNTLPTSNGRAQDPSYLPIVRMSNTYISPGDSDYDEMLSSLKDGFLLIGSKGGQVDTLKGDFHFNAMYGYKIENGEVAYPIKGISLGGNTLKILQNIEAISKQTGEGYPGFCGKDGQSVPVVGRNPYLLINNAIVGGK